MSARIQYDVHEGGLAQVTLAAPARMNAMSRQMWRELAQVFERIQADLSLRCVVLQGQGDHFCAGGDISEYASFRFQEASLRAFHEEDVWGGLQAMLNCDVPIVAQIAGNCMGAGVEMACCCDLRVAAADSRFGAPIARLGFPMAPREAALVLREVGAFTARQFLLDAALLDAATMAQRGFVHHVVAPADLPSCVQTMVARVLGLAPAAARLNKQTLRALHPIVFDLDSASASSPALADLQSRAYAYAPHVEHREGVQAFLDKRQPIFQANSH